MKITIKPLSITAIAFASAAFVGGCAHDDRPASSASTYASPNDTSSTNTMPTNASRPASTGDLTHDQTMAPATGSTGGTTTTPSTPANGTGTTTSPLQDAHASASGSSSGGATTTTPSPATGPGATDPNARSDADNTRVNARDRDHKGDATPTPMDQGNGKEDIRITADIRKSVVKDSALSFTAKNVKIITNGGKVVLRGPVKSAEERANIEAKARATAGVTDVDNQLEIKK